MNQIAVYLVDDNKDMLSLLDDYIDDIEGFEVSGKETDPLKALHDISEGEVRADIVCLDFEMQKMPGDILGEQIKNVAAIIYISGHRHYGPQAVKVQAASYLVKPVPFEAFKTALYQAKEIYEKRILLPVLPLQPFYFLPGTGKEARLLIRPDEVLYIEGDGNYSRVYMTGEKEITTYRSLKYLTQLLPEPFFCRVNKSNIVSLSKIYEYTAQDVTLQQGTEIAFGGTYRRGFIEMLQRFRMI